MVESYQKFESVLEYNSFPNNLPESIQNQKEGDFITENNLETKLPIQVPTIKTNFQKSPSMIKDFNLVCKNVSKRAYDLVSIELWLFQEDSTHNQLMASVVKKL